MEWLEIKGGLICGTNFTTGHLGCDLDVLKPDVRGDLFVLLRIKFQKSITEKIFP